MTEIDSFCKKHFAHFFDSRLPNEVWHYTNADGLIGILETGKIWSTQVTCLNDTLELRYFSDRLHRAVKDWRAQQIDDQKLAVALRVVDKALDNREFTTAGHFVACFSEVKDDLGQWRGYGGGECGYAIGFCSEGIREALKTRPGALFLPMNYDDKQHKSFVEDVLKLGEKCFHDAVKNGDDIEKWAAEFYEACNMSLAFFAIGIKHPTFSSEREWRITAGYNDQTDVDRLEFRQKHTLLARHLPLDLRIAADGGKRLLPITQIYVGPGASQQVSRISVGDLLLKCKYQGINVEMSKVPYRVP
jgi:hypothetical protein